MKRDFSGYNYQKHASYLRQVFSSPNDNILSIEIMEIKKWDRSGGVYGIINMKTEDFYIGSTNNFHKRKTQHESNLRQNKSCNLIMSRDVSKHGSEHFRFLRIHTVDEEDLIECENFWIQSLRPSYNMQVLAHRRGKKAGESSPGNTSEVGSHYSAPVLQLTEDGLVVDEYNSIKDAAIKFGGGRYGYLISKVCRGKIETAFGFRWKYKNGMTRPKPKQELDSPIIQIDPSTMQEIKEWTSKYEISRAFGLLPDTYRKAAETGTRLASGFYWITHKNKQK